MSTPRAFECYYFKIVLNWWHSPFKSKRRCSYFQVKLGKHFTQKLLAEVHKRTASNSIIITFREKVPLGILTETYVLLNSCFCHLFPLVSPQNHGSRKNYHIYFRPVGSMIRSNISFSFRSVSLHIKNMTSKALYKRIFQTFTAEKGHSRNIVLPWGHGQWACFM
jgi:hypothetical protein